jgi:hypothetical protein
MEKELTQLEALLRQQLAAHEQLAGLVQRKLAALRAADHRQVTACCHAENQRLQAIGELEKERLKLVAQLSLLLDPQAPAPLKLAEVAERLPEPARGRLLVLRQQLRQRMEQVQRDSAVARSAASDLVRHMTGLVQSIGACMTGMGVYSRGGARPQAATAVSTFQATA